MSSKVKSLLIKPAWYQIFFFATLGTRSLSNLMMGLEYPFNIERGSYG